MNRRHHDEFDTGGLGNPRFPGFLSSSQFRKSLLTEGPKLETLTVVDSSRIQNLRIVTLIYDPIRLRPLRLDR